MEIALFLADTFDLTLREADEDLNHHYIGDIGFLTSLGIDGVDTIAMMAIDAVAEKEILPMEYLWHVLQELRHHRLSRTVTEQLRDRVETIVRNFLDSAIEEPDMFHMPLEDTSAILTGFIVPSLVLSDAELDRHVERVCGHGFTHRYRPPPAYMDHLMAYLGRHPAPRAAFVRAFQVTIKQAQANNVSDAAAADRLSNAVRAVLQPFTSPTSTPPTFPSELFPGPGPNLLSAALTGLPPTHVALEMFRRAPGTHALPLAPDSPRAVLGGELLLHIQQASTRVFDTINTLLRAQPTREFAQRQIRAWLGGATDLAKDLRYRPRTAPSECAMVAVINALTRMALPVLTVEHPRGPDLKLGRSSGLGLSDATPLHTDGAIEVHDGIGGFVSNNFYYIHHGLSLGYSPLCDRLEELGQAIRRVEGVDRTQLTPHQAMAYDAQHHGTLDAAVYTQTVLQAVDHDVLLKFVGWTAQWLGVAATSPDPSQAKLVRSQPEAVLTNVTSALTLLVRVADVPASPFLPHILTATVALLDPSLVSSPHTRSALLQPLYLMLTSDRPSTRALGWREVSTAEETAKVLAGHPFALEHAVPFILQQYIDVEDHTSQGYYDRFQARAAMTEVLLVLWDRCPEYRAQLVAGSDGTVFRSFVSHAVGDLTFLLDEYRGAIDHMAASLDRDDDDAFDPTELHQRAQSVLFFKELAGKTMELVSRLSTMCPDVFLHPLLAPRITGQLLLLIADMPVVASILPRLVPRFGGDVCDQSVPASVARAAMTILVNVGAGGRDEWVAQLALNDRSLKEGLVSGCADLGIPPPLMLRAADLLTEAWAVKKASQEADRTGPDDDDAPHEFRDVITFEVMDDPVTMPPGQTVDRSTFDKFLMDGQLNPWTKMPIGEGDAVPDDGLRGRIKAWRAGETG